MGRNKPFTPAKHFCAERGYALAARCAVALPPSLCLRLLEAGGGGGGGGAAAAVSVVIIVLLTIHAVACHFPICKSPAFMAASTLVSPDYRRIYERNVSTVRLPADPVV